MEFDGVDFWDECDFLKRLSKETFTKEWPPNNYKPVAFFAWKLLDITEIWATKQPNFLESIQESVNSFHKNLSEQRWQSEAPIVKNTGDDSAFLESFLQQQLNKEYPYAHP